MKYLSCFSGIGGLEASVAPEAFCDSDPDAKRVLAKAYPGIPIWDDIRTFKPPKVEVVAGGWPCQDLSIAGMQLGLAGPSSGLIIDMLRVAKSARARTVVAENVPFLLRLNRGREFHESLKSFHEAGYPFVGWRVLNARAFGLPQHRSRVLLIASKDRDIVNTLFRTLPQLDKEDTAPRKRMRAAGFYWTAGTHSLNYSRGYIPTLKIGSGLNIASPPALHIGNRVRLVSPREALLLQGFKISLRNFDNPKTVFRLAGNAVPKPMGRWLMDGVLRGLPGTIPFEYEEQTLDDLQAMPLTNTAEPRQRHEHQGISIRGRLWRIPTQIPRPMAFNLIDFVDVNDESSLSPRASRGLLARLEKSGHPCPPGLKQVLEEIAA